MKTENKIPYAKGNRGIVFTADYKGKKIAIKAKNPKSEAAARIDIEAMFLKKLNKHGIGPKFLFFENGELGMEFIEGELFEDYIVKNNKKNITKVMKEVFRQMFIMDELGINKKEMHHPTKHIIIGKKSVTLIDFERCQHTEKPKNVTQFAQYVSKKRIACLLKDKDMCIDHNEVIELSKDYKENMSKKNLDRIIKAVS